LGKISDALEKSKKAKIVSASKIEEPEAAVKDRSPKGNIHFDKDDIILKKPSEAKIVSASKLEVARVSSKDRSLKRNISFDKDDIISKKAKDPQTVPASKVEIPKTTSKGENSDPSISFDRDDTILEKPSKTKIVPASKIERPRVAVKEGTPKRHTLSIHSDNLYDDDNFDKKMISFLMPQSYEAEQFKMLKTSILFPASGEPPRSIMVTSAVPGEGKSFVTANLAISIAQNIEEHVLIVDCDLRSPCIHKQFGFGSVTGLSEYLSNDALLDSLFLRTKVDKLSILPGGKSPKNPSELLSSQQMSKLLEEVKNRYGNRYVIIDSPPPRLTAETNVIARQVDGIILVVKHRHTRREVVEDLVKMVGKDKILGVVLNRSDLRISGYYGYGKYGKYHKYYGN
jgi:exopolysaccharide/PEP-CTERM locus tyrosine autokinase